MLGPPKTHRLDRPVLVSLEALVPPGHFYRYLDAKLDLSFVRDWVADRYAAGGRPSIDPIVFFKLQLILFFEGLRSERQLLEIASLNLAHRWYLGYHLDEPLPDHSSLSKIRARLGLPIFRRFFERVVELCDQAGLVWGKELLFDATKVRANAALDSLVPRLREVVDGHLEDLFAPDTGQGAPVTGVTSAPAAGEPADDASGTVLLRHPATARAARATDEEDTAAPSPPARRDLLEECRLDPDRPSAHGYQRKGALVVSTTDRDAAPMKPRNERASLGYHDHYVVDGGKARIILYPLVTPADVMENEPMLDLFRRVTFRWRLHPERAIADRVPPGRYGTLENVRALEDMGVRAYVPLPDFDDRTPFSGASRFTYDAGRDEYRCPQGHQLVRYSREIAEEITRYRADAAVCNACPVKAACTASDHGRTVRRSFHEDYLDLVRGYHATAAYQKRPEGTRHKRKVWPEPLFAEAKQWHGLRQFRLRGLPKVNMEALRIATGQNLKRWLAATGWGRRYAPCGSLMAAQSPTAPCGIRSSRRLRPLRARLMPLTTRGPSRS